MGQTFLLHPGREPHVPASGGGGGGHGAGPGQQLCHGRGLRGQALLFPDHITVRQNVRKYLRRVEKWSQIFGCV